MTVRPQTTALIKARAKAALDPDLQPLLVLDSEFTEQVNTTVIGLRRKLRVDYDPDLPSEYDGPAWWPLEQQWAGSA